MALIEVIAEFDNIKSEFNQRMEGMAKKVERNVQKTIDGAIYLKVK